MVLLLVDGCVRCPVWRTGGTDRPDVPARRVACSVVMAEHPMAQNLPLAVNRYRDARGGSLRPGDVGRSVRLAGWMAAKRDHGGLLFVDLRDPGGCVPGGLVQLVAHPDRAAFEVLSHLRVESVVSVSGKVVARPPETVNPKLDTGAVEVAVDSVEVLS